MVVQNTLPLLFLEIFEVHMNFSLEMYNILNGLENFITDLSQLLFS